MFSPEHARRQRRPRHGADVERLPARDPDRHARLHGHRDDLEHGRGGQGRGARRSPRRSTACASRSSPSTSRCRPSRCPRCRSRSANGEYQTQLGLTEEEGGFAGDPILGVVKAHGPRPAAAARRRSTSACSRRRSCSSPPTRASSASRGSSTRWASTARCPTGCAGCTRKLPHAVDRHPGVRRALAIVLILPGQADVPRQHLLVRRAAVVHDRPRLGGAPARDAARHAAALPRAGQPAHRRLRRAAVRARRRRLHGASPSSSSSSLNLKVAAAGVGWLVARHRRLRRLPPPPGAGPDLDAQGRDPAAGRRPRGGVRLRARARAARTATTSSSSPRRSSSPPASAAASTCS